MEESFRITKHDLKVRSVFHGKPDQVKAQIAIAYIVFACVCHLANRIALSSKTAPDADRISRILGLPLSRTPCWTE